MERRSRLVTTTAITAVLALVVVVLLATLGHGSRDMDRTLGAEPAGQDRATVRTTTISGQEFDYCGNGSINAPSTAQTRLVVIVHGLGGDACDLADATMSVAGPNTLVVAPRFLTREPGNHHSWPQDSWAQGDQSRNGSSGPPSGRLQGELAGVSSFTIVDELIADARNTLSANIHADPEVVLAGFSAGGQFVNRYAATSPAPVDAYLVASPSSYLWFNQDRPAGSNRCRSVDDYRYGLQHRNAYASRLSEEEIKQRYASRTITYLVGSSDDRSNSTGLDRSCAAQAQGANREQRATNYYHALEDFFGPEIYQRHHFELVPGVAHHGPKMLISDEAAAVLR